MTPRGDTNIEAENVVVGKKFGGRRRRFLSPLLRFKRSRGLPTSIRRFPKLKTLDEASTDENSLTSSSSDSSLSYDNSFDIIDSLLEPIYDDDVVSTTAVADTSQLGIASYDDLPNSSIHSCLKLLASEDLDRNKLGLQKLVLLTSGRKISGLYHSEELVSHILVYGGPWGSIEERLRYIFATMICNAPHDDQSIVETLSPVIDLEEKEALFDWILDYDPQTGIDGNGHHISYYDVDNESTCSSSSSSSHSECSLLSPQGKANGALHNAALRVLANATGQIAQQKRFPTTTNKEKQIPFHGPIWKNILQSLSDNIETNRNADATLYSLKILRHLHSLHPQTLEPLLAHTLLEHLAFLEEYGAHHHFPGIHAEASYLRKKAQSSKVWI